MPTVCIIYGVLEGPQLGKRLRHALKAAGYETINNPARADVIITHSGGSLLLPKKVRAKQIIQIAPYWPGKTWVASAIRKVIDDFHVHHKEGEMRFWLRKGLWNFIYLGRVASVVQMLGGLKAGNHWRHGRITIVVRPRHDTFCAADYDYRFKESPAFLSFPGHHDDCWRDPKPYIALLK
jgi:hypothetical protein